MNTFLAEWDQTTRCDTCRCPASHHVPDPSRGPDGGRCLDCGICPERPEEQPA